MTTHILIVHSAPLPGKQAQMEAWYRDTHLQEVLQLPGFVAARRYWLDDEVLPGTAPRHIAIFELETDDVTSTIKGLTDAFPRMVQPDAIDPQSLSQAVYRASGLSTDAPA